MIRTFAGFLVIYYKRARLTTLLLRASYSIKNSSGMSFDKLYAKSLK